MSSLLPEGDEHLTTGWEPGLDAANAVARRAVLVHTSWAVAPARTLGHAAVDGDEWAAGHVGNAAGR